MNHKVLLMCLLFLLAVSTATIAQTPNYSMLDPKPYDPSTDSNIDMYMGSRKESMPSHTHGSLVERDILTSVKAMNPTARGAVLEYANRFTFATLDAYESTSPT